MESGEFAACRDVTAPSVAGDAAAKRLAELAGTAGTVDSTSVGGNAAAKRLAELAAAAGKVDPTPVDGNAAARRLAELAGTAGKVDPTPVNGDAAARRLAEIAAAAGKVDTTSADGDAVARRLAEVAGAAGKADPVLSLMPKVEPSDIPVDKPGPARRLSCPKYDTAPAKLAELQRSRTGTADPNAIAISSLVRGAISGTPTHKAVPGLARDQIVQPGAPKTLEPSSAAAGLNPKPGPKGGGRLNAGAFGSAPARGSRPRPAAPAPVPAPAEPATPASPLAALPIIGAPAAAPVQAVETPAVPLPMEAAVPQPVRRLDQPVTDSDRRLILSKFASAPTRGRAAPRREAKTQRPTLPVHLEAEHGQSDDEGGRVDRPADRPAARRKPLDTQSNASEDIYGEGMSDLGEDTPQTLSGEPGTFLGVTCEEEGA